MGAGKGKTKRIQSDTVRTMGSAVSQIEVRVLRPGGIYWLRCRNLRFGVWNGRGFTGIREKFGSRFLDTEYPNTVDSLGTVTRVQYVGQIDASIPLEESLGSVCSNCGEEAWWTGPPSPADWACTGGCAETHPQSVSNAELFAALDALETGKVDKRVRLQPTGKVVDVVGAAPAQLAFAETLAEDCVMVLVEQYWFLDGHHVVEDKGAKITQFPGNTFFVLPDGTVVEKTT